MDVRLENSLCGRVLQGLWKNKLHYCCTNVMPCEELSLSLKVSQAAHPRAGGWGVGILAFAYRPEHVLMPLAAACSWFGLSPLPVTVTTRIITFLVGDPYKPSFATVTGRGDNPIHNKFYGMTKEICARMTHVFMGVLGGVDSNVRVQTRTCVDWCLLLWPFEHLWDTRPFENLRSKWTLVEAEAWKPQNRNCWENFRVWDTLILTFGICAHRDH